MDYNKAALEMHAAHRGKLTVQSLVPCKAVSYTHLTLPTKA